MTSSSPIPQALFPDGARVPRLGLGTWRMGEVRGERTREIAALREGIATGMTLIDTAEMYGEGGAEQVVAEAIADCRDRVFLVSKFYPHHASRKALHRACEDSLRRLRTDRLDLYLLHWRGTVPLSQTVHALRQLVAGGKIVRWGVSNFDVANLDEAERAGGEGQIASNQGASRATLGCRQSLAGLRCRHRRLPSPGCFRSRESWPFRRRPVSSMCAKIAGPPKWNSIHERWRHSTAPSFRHAARCHWK